ncbi:hypothetical protein AVL50_28305 [Flammeovirga sp. SJP92]|nr:hypothetical protein AVL50_28305 [Flammeovirga sp. SJP92]
MSNISYCYSVAPDLDLYQDINSIEKHGDIMVVGGIRSSDYAGAAYVYKNVNNVWENVAILRSSKGLLANDDLFGFSIAVNDDVIVVGAPLSGKVYVYEKPASGWSDMTETLELSSPYHTGDHFGYSVALGDNEIAVGAFKAYNYQGRIALYKKSAGSKWSTQTPKLTTLTSSSPSSKEYVGHEIALAGSTLVSGAIGNSSWTGALYVFDIDSSVGSTITAKAKLTSSAPDFQLGMHVSISEDGNFIAATEYGRSKKGSVKIFKKSAGSDWTDRKEAFSITESELVNNDHFGAALSISGNGIAISARSKNNNKGKVYEYALNFVADSARLVKTYVAEDGQEGDLFGKEVCYFGNSELVVAAPVKEIDKLYFFGNATGVPRSNYTRSRHLDIDGDVMVLGAFETTETMSGTAFVYERQNGKWLLKAKLTPSDRSNNDMFGFAVSIHGDDIVVGAPASNTVYVYEKPASGWANATETKTLKNPLGSSGYFGFSVDNKSSEIVVGAYRYSGYTGRGFYFTKTGASWKDGSKVTTLVSPSPRGNEYFGHQIRLSDDAILVGALGKNSWRGTAYVYNLPASGFNTTSVTPDVELVSPDNSGFQYGIHLDIEGDRIAITDYVSSSNLIGKVHIFEKNSGALWTSNVPHLTINNPSSSHGDGFGSDVKLKGGSLLVGAYGEEVHGGAYLYNVDVANSTYDSLALFVPAGETDAIRFGTGVRFHDDHVVVLAEENPEQFFFTFNYPVGVSNLREVSGGSLASELQNSVPKLLNTDPLLRGASSALQFIDLSNNEYSYSIFSADGRLLQNGKVDGNGNVKLNVNSDHLIIKLVDTKANLVYTFRY